MYYREMTKPHSIHLTNEQMNLTAPSVFADRPYHDVSSRYGYIPTIQVIDELRRVGWQPIDATQKNVRIKEKAGFTKHLVRFRRLDNDIKVGDSVVELVLTNSHDKSAAFVLHAGIFRMVCANGIVTADSTFQKVSVRHNKNAVGHVIDGAYSVINDVPKITSEVESMMNIQLSEREQKIFANTVLNYILPDHVVTSKDNLIAQILRPRRQEDTKKDLWSTFNVVQEKALRGGLHIMKLKPESKFHSRSTTREVKSIDKNIKLNKALWSMAEQMRDLKN